MKKSFLIFSVSALVMAVSFHSCKRVADLLDPNIAQHNEDSNDLKSELDQVDSDINNALSSISGFGKTDGASAVFSSPLCGVTIDSSELAQHILYFNFDGVTPCFSPSRTRSGQIKVQLTEGTHWGDVGSVLTETFIDYKITRLSDGRSIEFDGIKTLENVNGNDWLGFLAGTASLMYRERTNNMQVTFDNNLNAVWNSARTTQWDFTTNAQDPNIPVAYLTFTANGDTTIDGHATTDSWGVNRFGSDFITYYNTGLTSNTYCGFWRFLSGELVHSVNSNEYSLTLGVDQNGNASTLDCAYGYKVSWDIDGESNSQVFSY